MKKIGCYKYYRHLDHIYDLMKAHYKKKQDHVHDFIRRYYQDNFNTIPDENGRINIVVSYDGTWMKRGHIPQRLEWE